MNFPKKLFLHFIFVFLLSTMFLLPMSVSAAKIHLSQTSVTLLTGQKIRLKLEGTDKKLIWSSSKKSVATVNSKGRVKALKKGRTVISVRIKGRKKVYECKVRVKKAPADDEFVGSTNAEKIYRFLITRGFSRQASAAVVGNLIWESGGGSRQDVILNAVEFGSGRGIGMCQWTDTFDAKRRTNFLKYCNYRGVGWPNTSLRVQVDFLMKELEGDYGKIWYFLDNWGYPSAYKMTFEEFKKCRNITKATAIFCANFERPKAYNAGLSWRTVYARNIYNKYK